MELNVLELKDKLDSKKITLIDVREDYELKICHIENSKHISMNQIQNNLDQLDKKNRYAHDVTVYSVKNPAMSR